MVYWKIDDQTIRCLINKDEISQMGYDLNVLSKDSSVMSDFLDTIVSTSHKYIDWDTENGVQNYIARALPADQFLFTISCTLQDDAIDQDLDQIKRMFQALNHKISMERIEEILEMSGEEKEKAFQELSKDLHDVCTGKTAAEESAEESESGELMESDSIDNNVSDESAALQTETGEVRKSIAGEQDKKDQNTVLPPQKLIFKDMSSLLEFTSLLNKKQIFSSDLYRDHDQYDLLLDFDHMEDKAAVISLLITAEEYGAVCQPLNFSRYYLKEHAQLLIAENALEVLWSMSH